MRISDWSSDVCSSDLAAHEQFAIDHRILIERRDQFGERPADLLAATAVDARLAAPAHDLDTNAIPFPLGGIVGKVDAALLQRTRKHEGAKEGDVGKVGPLRPTLAPREQRCIEIGRASCRERVCQYE